MDPETVTARIPARSQREAMDWSLVLMSQGIESVLEGPTEVDGWGLRVSAASYEGALQVLRQYLAENRHWPWQREVWKPGLLFDWVSLAWLVLMGVFYWLDAQRDLRAAGLMDPVAVSHGQWWRLFTAVWLHADLGHWGANASLGLILVGLTMGKYGTGVGLLAAYLAGAGGNLARWLIAADLNPSLGASGMVMGALGLLAVQGFPLLRSLPRPRAAFWSSVAAGVMLFILLGLAPGTDILAHAGGFASGLVIGAALSALARLRDRGWLNLACGLAFALLLVLPWWLALAAGVAR